LRAACLTLSGIARRAPILAAVLQPLTTTTANAKRSDVIEEAQTLA